MTLVIRNNKAESRKQEFFSAYVLEIMSSSEPTLENTYADSMIGPYCLFSLNASCVSYNIRVIDDM